MNAVTETTEPAGALAQAPPRPVLELPGAAIDAEVHAGVLVVRVCTIDKKMPVAVSIDGRLLMPALGEVPGGEQPKGRHRKR